MCLSGTSLYCWDRTLTEYLGREAVWAFNGSSERDGRCTQVHGSTEGFGEPVCIVLRSPSFADPSRWHTAGRLWFVITKRIVLLLMLMPSTAARDILYELASVGDLPLPQPSPPGGTKRERDSDSPTLSSRSTSTPRESPRTIAGTRRISRDIHAPSQHPRQQPRTPPQAPQAYNLPVYSNDLGRLPVHGQVNFATNGSTGGPTSPGQPTNMWFPSMTSGTQPQTHSAPIGGHGYAHADAYALDDLFLDQIGASAFGGFAAPPVDAGSAHELQALMDAAAAGVPPSMIPPTNEMLNVDPDTIAMWSSAPTGFG